MEAGVVGKAGGAHGVRRGSLSPCCWDSDSPAPHSPKTLLFPSLQNREVEGTGAGQPGTGDRGGPRSQMSGKGETEEHGCLW